MSLPPDLAARRRELEDAATHLGRPHALRFRPMFGGLMAYLDERPCAWLTPGALALKLPPAEQPVLLRIAGTARLVVKPGAAPSRHYIVLPAALSRDTARLAGWLAKSARH
ncbi:TfoX/Sxy family protein [Rhodanobacter sp. OR87]|uniref:TfoX/Sxy family protein n=1 Tax=Rhodanobacter sp. OR87 TaxID=1076523 RepID=UPI00040B6D7F|nr:TfoX/Sxy family protein [Rhodanobacter sp. OR87]